MSDLREAARQSAAILRGNIPAPAEQATASPEVPADNHTARPVELDASIEASGTDVPVHVAYSRVMGDVQYVVKSRATDEKGRPVSGGLNYPFRGIDALLNAVGPALRKHGLMFVPSRIISKEHDQVPTAGGKVMQRCKVTIAYAAIGPAGDVFPLPIESIGEAFDSGDKAGSKAMSVALRTAYIQAFAIPVKQPEMDPEHGPQYEVASPSPASAEELRDEIVSPVVTLERLSTISDELKHPSRRATAVQEVPGRDGEDPMRLIDLVYRIAKERMGKGTA